VVRGNKSLHISGASPMTIHDSPNQPLTHAQGYSLASSALPTLESLAAKPATDRRLEGIRSWISSSITEKGSGVRFVQKSDGVWARLGRRETALPEILPKMLTSHPAKGPLSRDFERAFHEHVVPELIQPTREELLGRIEAWRSRTCEASRTGIGLRSVSIVHEDPLVISISGSQPVIMGRLLLTKPVHYFVEWSNCGSLRFIDRSNGSQRLVPLDTITRQLNLPFGILGALLDKMR
jgi:hypothetical protein